MLGFQDDLALPLHFALMGVHQAVTQGGRLDLAGLGNKAHALGISRRGAWYR